MNLMRKLRGSGGATSISLSSNTEMPEGPPGSPHTQLGLMHLKKLFSEYTHPTHPLTDTEKDEKLYSMLPLFCKVCVLYFLWICAGCLFYLGGCSRIVKIGIPPKFRFSLKVKRCYFRLYRLLIYLILNALLPFCIISSVS